MNKEATKEESEDVAEEIAKEIAKETIKETTKYAIEKVHISEVRPCIIELACDIESAMRLYSNILSTGCESRDDATKALIEQVYETSELIEIPAEDDYIKRSLLLLSIRIIELRNKM